MIDSSVVIPGEAGRRTRFAAFARGDNPSKLARCWPMPGSIPPGSLGPEGSYRRVPNELEGGRKHPERISAALGDRQK
jgi:hypothetical protein